LQFAEGKRFEMCFLCFGEFITCLER